MKNVFFSLAFMLIGSFAFAKNDVVSNLKDSNKASISKISLNKNVGICEYSIIYTSINRKTGEVTQTEVRYSTWAFSAEHCRNIQTAHVSYINNSIQ